jgi:hypothetical protein
MDGAVYHGDPSNRTMMKESVLACRNGVAQLRAMRTTATDGPAKLFLVGRLLDRTATLTFMGLDDAEHATPEVRTANLYFRIAAGLSNQSAEYRDAALANVELTQLQLRTLDHEIAARRSTRPRTVALHRLATRDPQSSLR